jgi:hypothetical protein
VRNRDLEHPQLVPFEPILKRICTLVFEQGIEALQKAALLRDPKDLISVIDANASAFRRFIRGCHYGWDLAQHKICELIIDYEQQVRKLRQELKESLRNRNKGEIEKKKQLISCVVTRQVVLRRLADTILYHLFKMQNWIPRRMMLEYRIRDIEPDTLRKTVEMASDLNREERLDFHLAADLTTTVHVGDLVKVSFVSKPARWSLIELKEGKMNALLSDIIEEGKGSLTDEHINKIRDQFGTKAVSQAKRMLRQQDRHREVMRAVETDEGIDIMHNVLVRLNPEEVEIDDYRETIGNLCEKARTDGVAVSIVDGCFRLIAVNDKSYEKLGRMGIAHLFYHLQFGIQDCALSVQNKTELHGLTKIYPSFDLVQMNLYALWPPPVFLWLPDDFVRDLLFGRLSVFGQLDYTKLFECARSEGFEMRWIQRKELGEFQGMSGLIPGSPNAVGIGVKIADDPSCKEQFILIGYLSRMFLEFMSPSQFLKLVRKDFEFAAALRSDSEKKKPESSVQRKGE